MTYRLLIDANMNIKTLDIHLPKAMVLLVNKYLHMDILNKDMSSLGQVICMHHQLDMLHSHK